MISENGKNHLYPVSQKTFDFIKKHKEFKSVKEEDGFKRYTLEQKDESSGVVIEFDIYVSPLLDTKFTSIIKTDI